MLPKKVNQSQSAATKTETAETVNEMGRCGAGERRGKCFGRVTLMIVMMIVIIGRPKPPPDPETGKVNRKIIIIILTLRGKKKKWVSNERGEAAAAVATRRPTPNRDYFFG